MYQKAINQGSPMKYNTFLNVVNKHLPQVASSSFNIEDVAEPYIDDPQYAYYFYPLQSFRHQLNNFQQRPVGVCSDFIYYSKNSKSVFCKS